MSLESMMSHEVVIEAPLLTDDGMGGSKQSWAGGQAFKGFVQPMSAVERDMHRRAGVEATHHVYLPPEAPVMEQSRITFNGRRFEVKGVREAGEGQWPSLNHKKIDCVELR
jgi:head-tail adaptor